MSTPESPGLSDRARDLIDELAREVAGDDRRAYLETAVALVNIAGEVAESPRGRQAELALQQLAGKRPARRTAARRRGLSAAETAPAVPAVEATIYADETFLANAEYLLRNRRRIVGGQPTADFPDCVAVGAPNQWCCSGTLVAPRLVVTAAHCPGGGCSSRVLFGESTEDGSGRVIDVEEVIVHEDYVPDGASDVAALVLAEPVDSVAPRRIAGKDAVDAARTTRLVGFGNVDVFASTGYGRKRLVDVPLASSDPRFGADPGLEFVAGSPFLDKDSCTGDSGGPAYVEIDGSWLLAGATSRATASSVRPCGDGGIYGRIHAFEEWLRSLPGDWERTPATSGRRG
jgi:secreted trypsin-like serine protease